jgi:hypothetical protein
MAKFWKSLFISNKQQLAKFGISHIREIVFGKRAQLDGRRYHISRFLVGTTEEELQKHLAYNK